MYIHNICIYIYIYVPLISRVKTNWSKDPNRISQLPDVLQPGELGNHLAGRKLRWFLVGGSSHLVSG